MFDRIDARPKKPKSRLALMFSLSIGAHVAVVLALLVAGFWQIERLMPPDRQVSLVTSAGMRAVEPSGPAPVQRIEPKVQKRLVKSLVQPQEEREITDEPQVSVELGNGDPDATGDGPIGVGTGTGDGTFAIGDTIDPAIPVLTAPPPLTPMVPREKDVTNIPAHFLDGKRIAGDERIMPPDSVRVSMHRSGEQRIHGTIKMCLDERGQVTSLTVLRSTGYEHYDTKLLSGMRHWRYKPYTANGAPVPVCTPIEYIYQIVG